jgi:hypothetical protein
MYPHHIHLSQILLRTTTPAARRFHVIPANHQHHFRRPASSPPSSRRRLPREPPSPNFFLTASSVDHQAPSTRDTTFLPAPYNTSFLPRERRAATTTTGRSTPLLLATDKHHPSPSPLQPDMLNSSNLPRQCSPAITLSPDSLTTLFPTAKRKHSQWNLPWSDHFLVSFTSQKRHRSSRANVVRRR